MSIMNKSNLIKRIALITKITKKEADLVLTTILETIIEVVSKGEKITLMGFGSFRIKHRESRNGINPKTKEKIIIPTSKRSIFIPGKFFKNKVNTLN